MTNVWDKLSPAQAFMIRLRAERIDGFLADKSFLKSLRLNWPEVQRLSAYFKPELEERGINFAEAVLKASVPDPSNYDNEDDEKVQSLSMFMQENSEPPKKRIHFREGIPRDWNQFRLHLREKSDLIFQSSHGQEIILPPDLLQLVLEFKGPNEPEPEAPEEPTDPWAVPHPPGIPIEVSA